jgi:hypothetical protein
MINAEHLTRENVEIAHKQEKRALSANGRKKIVHGLLSISLERTLKNFG